MKGNTKYQMEKDKKPHENAHFLSKFAVADVTYGGLHITRISLRSEQFMFSPHSNAITKSTLECKFV